MQMLYSREWEKSRRLHVLDATSGYYLSEHARPISEFSKRSASTGFVAIKISDPATFYFPL